MFIKSISSSKNLNSNIHNWRIIIIERDFINILNNVFPYTVYSEEEEPFGVSKPRLSWGTEALDREDEEEGSKIDGLCGSDLVAFYGLRRKDILNFLERSLSKKEKTCTRGIRRIERRPSKFAWLAGPHNLCMHIVTWNMNGKVHKSIYSHSLRPLYFLKLHWLT